MPIKKNTADQTVVLYVHDASTGRYAATQSNFVATISKDHGTPNATINSITEVASGIYSVDLEKEETNCDHFFLHCTNTSNVDLIATVVDGSNGRTDDSPPNDMQLTVTSATTTEVTVTAPSGVASGHLLDAVVSPATNGRIVAHTRVTNVTEDGSTFILTVSPSLPEEPEAGDLFRVGPKYLDSI